MEGRREVTAINRFELLELRAGLPAEGLTAIHWDLPELRVRGDRQADYRLVVDGCARPVRAGESIRTRYRRAELWRGGHAVAVQEFDPRGRKILVHFNSQCLGDTLAWMPAVAAFRDRHQPGELVCSTFYSSLFDEPGLRRIDAEGHLLREVYAFIEISYDKQNPAHRRGGIRDVAAQRLGVDPGEARPRLRLPAAETSLPRPYVCLAPCSPKPIARWRYPGGWEHVAAHVAARGYTPVAISAETEEPVPGALARGGFRPLADRLAQLAGAACFVGLSSGLAWLAWAVGCPVVMLAGFTLPHNEFPCQRVIDRAVCHGCWNEVCSSSPCPRHAGTDRQWECSRALTPALVCAAIDRALASPPPGAAGTPAAGH